MCRTARRRRASFPLQCNTHCRESRFKPSRHRLLQQPARAYPVELIGSFVVSVQERPKMPRFASASIIAWFSILTPALAAEELSIDKLEVQAKIPHRGDFMAFGFGSLWMMSGGKMIRVNPTDNS